MLLKGMNPPVGSSIKPGGSGRFQSILLLTVMSSLAARGESNPASENAWANGCFDFRTSVL